MPTLIEYIDSVETTLQYWLEVHTNPVKWAEEWIMDDPEYFFKNNHTVKNNYFEFELAKEIYSTIAKRTIHEVHKCKNCGCINDGYDCCNDPKLIRATIAEYTEWLKEIEVTPTDTDIINTMEKQGFKVYRNALKDIIAPVIGEVKDVLKKIRSSRTNEDKLEAVLWGTRVFHVHGNIMQDYGDRAQNEVDYTLINSIRNDGLTSVFTREEISEYIEEK